MLSRVAPSPVARLASAIGGSLWLNRHSLILMGLYLGAVEILSRIFGFPNSLRLYNIFWLELSSLMFLLIISGAMIVSCVRHRPPSPLRHAYDCLCHRWRVGERFFAAVPIFVVFPLFISSFTSIKGAIGSMNSYDWDPLFGSLDAALHGGPAWELIDPIVGFPLASSALNFVYNVWFFIMYCVLALVATWTARNHVRNQFLVAFLLCWIVLGTACAIPLASVGPCFYGSLYPEAPNPYAELMAYLHEAEAFYPIWSLDVQERLWDNFSQSQPGLAKGLSAMPSLHVAIAALLSIFGWTISRAWGVLGTIYLFLIMLGSVHLGWHYAIDGYFSIAVVPILWWLSGLLVRERNPIDQTACPPPEMEVPQPAGAT